MSVDVLNVDGDLEFGENGLDGAEVVEVIVSRLGVSGLNSLDGAFIITCENGPSCVELIGLA